MTVYEFLEEIKEVNRCIAADERALEQIRLRAYSVSGVSFDHERVQSSNQSDVGKKVEDMDELERKLKEDKRRLRRLQSKAKTYIEKNYKPSLMYAILTDRYISLMNWHEMSIAENYADSTLRNYFSDECKKLRGIEWKD